MQTRSLHYNGSFMTMAARIWLLICVYSCYADTKLLSDDDHGKIIGFHRNANISRILFPYIHKGIVFIPSAYNGDLVIDRDSRGVPMTNEPYVLHVWNPGPGKYLARVSIDPLKKVSIGDSWEIVAEERNSLPVNETINRAVRLLGKRPLNEHYNLVGNNCGNFVSYVKYGHGAYETQFAERATETLTSVGLEYLTPFVKKLNDLIDGYYREKETNEN